MYVVYAQCVCMKCCSQVYFVLKAFGLAFLAARSEVSQPVFMCITREVIQLEVISRLLSVYWNVTQSWG